MASAESIDMENKSVRLVRSNAMCCSSGSELCVDNSSDSLKRKNKKDRNSNSDGDSNSNSNSNGNDSSLNKTVHVNTSNTDKTQAERAATFKRRMTEPWGPHPPLSTSTLRKVSDTNTDVDVEDECCDLGLGLGLKPGGLPRLPESNITKPQNLDAKNGSTSTSSSIGSGISSPPACSRPISDHYYLCERHTTKKKWYKCLKKSDHGTLSNSGLSRKFSRQRRRSKSSVSSIEEQEDSDISVLCPAFPDHSRTSDDEEPNEETFPAFADVPMGTSIRQQKMLFEHDTNEILNRSPVENGCSREILNKVINLDPILCWRCYEEQDIEDRLRRAEQEVRILRHELDRAQKQLDTKYKAIQILQKTSQVAQCEHDATSRKVLNMTKAMEQEINKLQFELEYRQSSLMDSQQTWAGRFDSVCQDNAALVTSLEERTEELRRVRSDKMASCRERDELLALLDVKERLKYEQTRVTGQAEDAYSEFTSNELAVLGACNCRGTCGEPCGCAYAAANLRREVIKLKDIVETQKRRREEANTTADAYRMAFEEQLYRNKALTIKLAEITSPLLAAKNNNKRPLSVLKWLVKQLNDDVPPRKPRSLDDSKQQLTKEATKKDNDNKSSKDNNNKSPKHDRKLEKSEDSEKSETSGEAGTSEVDEQTLPTNDPEADSKVAAESAGIYSTEDDVAETSETTVTSESLTSDSVADVATSTSTTTAADDVASSAPSSSDVTATPTPPGGRSSGEPVQENAECTEEKPDYSSDDIMAIQNEQQLIAYLLERLSEQNELLAHQRLATRMLATRTSELESRLSLHGDDLNDVSTP